MSTKSKASRRDAIHRGDPRWIRSTDVPNHSLVQELVAKGQHVRAVGGEDEPEFKVVFRTIFLNRRSVQSNHGAGPRHWNGAEAS